MPTDSQTSRPQPPAFPKTRWSVVLAAQSDASPASAAALEAICRAYWYPLYAYVRRRGQAPDDAQDTTQEFFHRLLEKRWLDSVAQEKGRLRSFLITALKRFMVSEWRRASSQRRGGGHVQLQLDTAFAESRLHCNSTLPPDEAFDHHWAMALHDLALERLQHEFEAAGKLDDFQHLKACLMAARGEIDYASVAAGMNTTEGAARVAVHRLRKRFREVYREEIAHTLSNPEDAEAEIRHLAQALART